MRLTPYGPGKFSFLVDVVVYGYSMEGALDDETGDVETSGWFGLLRGPIDPTGSEVETRLSPADRAFLSRMDRGGAIISGNSDGFVFVDYFDRAEDLSEEWDRVVLNVSAFLEDSEVSE